MAFRYASLAACCSLLVLLVPLLSPAPALAQDLQIDGQKNVLDNGVTVLVWEREAADRVGARTFYQVDIAAERPGTVGLTHMLEHFLFMGSDRTGTDDWETEDALAREVEHLNRAVNDEKNRLKDCMRQRSVFAEIERNCRTPRLDSLQQRHNALAAQQNAMASAIDFDIVYHSAGGTGLTASTGRDWMKFDIDLPADNLETFMWMERSRIEHPVFRFFEEEREVVVDQIRRQDNRPDGPFERVLRSMTYDAHPYGWAHWFSDLEKATREDHWEIFHEHFIPQNLIITIVGDVEASTVFDLAERYWGGWQPGRPSPRLRTVEPVPVGEKRLTVEANAGPALVVHVPMPAVGHDDSPAFDVLAELLRGEAGLLHEQLVESSGVAVSVEASTWRSKYPSHFTIRVEATNNEALADVEREVFAVLDRLAAGSVDDARLRGAAQRLRLDMARSFEAIGPSAVHLGSMEAIHTWDYYNDLPHLWNAVTTAELAAVVERYFAPDMRTIGVLRRATDEQAAESAHALDAHDAAPSTAAAQTTYDRERPGLRPGGDRPDTAYRVEAGSEAPEGDRHLRRNEVHRQAASKRAVDTTDVSHPSAFPVDVRAVAEQPWYSPPWMAATRPARFADALPVAHHSELDVSVAPFTYPDPETHRIDLSLESEAYVVENALLPMVQATAYVDASTRHDPAGQGGLAALTAHAVRHGGTPAMPAAAINEQLTALGASITVKVDENQTQFHLVAPAAEAPELIGLLGSMLVEPAFPDAAVAEQRSRLADATDRARGAASVQVRQRFLETLYGDDHPLTRFATSATVESIDREAVRVFYNRHYAPSSLRWAVSGAIDAEEVARALQITARSEADPEAEPTVDAPEALPAAGRMVVTDELETRQAHVMIGFPGIEGLPEDHAALELMHYNLAGGGFLSRMMQLLRVETGITSALYGEVEPGQGVANPYLFRFSGNPETIARGVRLALEEIEAMYEDGVTEEELERARTAYLAGNIAASYDTPHKTASRMAHKALFGRFAYQSPQYMHFYAGDAAFRDALETVTVEEANAAARRYLDPENITITVLGPLDTIRTHASDEERMLLELD